MSRKRPRPAEPEVNRSALAHPSPSPQPLTQRSALVELYGTAFVTGGAVMVIEILGTRIVGPVFGVSLFVWAALLAVTLASLAGGYYLGGALADRTPTRRLFGLTVTGAGVA